MMTHLIRLLCATVLLAGWQVCPAAVTGQWDFDSGDLAPTVGAPLEYRGGTAARTLFVTSAIGGATAHVMQFPGTIASEGYVMSHGIAPNGGGAFVNEYTLIMDVMFPAASSDRWRALLQSNPDNVNDGELFINPNNGIGISGVYHGQVQTDTWHRLAFTVQLSSAALVKYIDGVLVGSQTLASGVDGRWALDPTALLFADENNETAAGFVNSIQVHDRALSDSEIAALGGATAEGISAPGIPSFRVTAPDGGEVLVAGNPFTIRWTASNAVGDVRIDLYRGASLATTLVELPLANLEYEWVISPFVGDSSDYRIRLTSLIQASLFDESDAPFSITGSLGEPNPNFGRPLQANGGFENDFQTWTIVQGAPVVMTGGGAKGAAHGGQRFFHGGLNQSGDAHLRQEIDLIGAGFTPTELDAGPVFEAEAFLRNWFGAGNFDDQVFYQVVFLGTGDEPLSSLRCIVAADNTWLRRPLHGLLPAGARKLHVEVIGRHRRDADNDSMADDIVVRLQLPGPRPVPVITKLPMLQDVRQEAMALLWETDSNLAVHEVWWGLDGSTPNRVGFVDTLEIDSTHFVHRASISPLQAQTEYFYKVKSGAAESPVFRFRTAPAPETPFRVVWFADNQNGPNVLRQHMERISQRAPDLIAVAGDTVQNGNAIGEWQSQWFGPFEVMNVAQRIPVIFARGNHDGEHALAYAYSLLPGNESWFAFTYGNCRFIFLDSEASTSASPEQLAWLNTELRRPESLQARFRIACFHRPPFTDLWDSSSYMGEAFVRNDWVQLFEQFNVDLVVSGHAHAYERGLRNGVVYLVVGGGGGALDTVRSAQWGIFDVLASEYHYNVMDVNGDTLQWTAYDLSNNVLDGFTLQSQTPGTDGPAFVGFTIPTDGASGVAPDSTIEARLIDAQTSVVESSIELFLDAVKVPAVLVQEGSGSRIIQHQHPSLLAPNSIHQAAVAFLDSEGTRVFRQWQFTVADYPAVDLPAPLYFEDFEALFEGQLPVGWQEMNSTDQLVAGLNFSDPNSDAYLGWTVVPRSRLEGQPFDPRRLNVAFVVKNGEVVTSLVNGNLAYAESDNRAGNQEQYLFSPDFDLSGHEHVYLSYHSIYEQNQDSIGAVEYSIDGGASWLPVVYMLDDTDVVRVGGAMIDAVATFNAARNDTAFGRSYGEFIGATVSPDLADHISPRVNDDAVESKRVELFPLPEASGQAAVRFRFAQAGTSSWYFGIDDFGLYSIPPGAGQPILLSSELTGDVFVLTWQGGSGRYQVQRGPVLGGPWENAGPETVQTRLELTPDTAAAFYRVVGLP